MDHVVAENGVSPDPTKPNVVRYSTQHYYTESLLIDLEMGKLGGLERLGDFPNEYKWNERKGRK